MKNKLQIFTLALVAFIFTNSYAKTTTYNGSTWNNGAPSGSSDVVIITGGTYNLPANITYASLTLSGGNFNVNGRNFSVTDVTLNSGTFTAAASTSFSGTLTMNGGSYTLGNTTRTLTVNNLIVTSGTLSLPCPLTVNNTLTLNGGSFNVNGRNINLDNVTLTSGTFTAAADTDFGGTLTLNGGAYTLGSSTRELTVQNLSVTSGTFSLPSILTVSSGSTFNGGSINLNGNTLNTPSPTFTSGSLTSTNGNSYVNITTGTHTNSLISLTAGTVEYNNVTISSAQTVTNNTIITGTLRLNTNANLDLNGKYVDLINENIDVRGNATITGTSLQKLNAIGGTLTIDGGTLTLNNVELIIEDLSFQTSHDIVSTNGGFLAFDFTNNTHGFTSADNTSHVNTKLRLYTKNGNSTSNVHTFPIGDGSIYSPFIFTLTSVTGTDSFGQWVEATYIGAQAPQTALDLTTLNSASGYEYWIVASSANTLTGRLGLRYDNNASKTGKSVVGSVTNLSADLKLAQYNTSSSKWVGINSGNSATGGITTSTSSSSVNPTSNWTLASNNARTAFVVPLPVSLINFDAIANKTNKSVELKWATASEENNSHFEIMHSTDFVNWTSIGKVYSNGNSNELNVYSFTDLKPSLNNYYKLKIVDLNGETAFSNMKVVKFTENILSNINIFPNPANANVNISIDNMDLSTPMTISLVNPMGQVVFEQIITENLSGKMSTSIPTSEFASGVYQVTFSGTFGKVAQKLIITHR